MNPPVITIDPTVLNSCPDLQLGCLHVQVQVIPSPPDLLKAISEKTAAIQSALSVGDIHDIKPLKDTRIAYKSLGKDPSRYRPSAEALLRRIVQGKGLYRVNNVVDALNLVSVSSGFSIGGYDMEKINGEITLGKGTEDEPYEAIGRGVLNIGNLPVLRDATGAFGSPTSDSTRTMVTESTTRFLAVFFNFGNNKDMQKAIDQLKGLLTT